MLTVTTHIEISVGVVPIIATIVFVILLSGVPREQDAYGRYAVPDMAGAVIKLLIVIAYLLFWVVWLSFGGHAIQQCTESIRGKLCLLHQLLLAHGMTEDGTQRITRQVDEPTPPVGASFDFPAKKWHTLTRDLYAKGKGMPPDGMLIASTGERLLVHTDNGAEWYFPFRYKGKDVKVAVIPSAL